MLDGVAGDGVKDLGLETGMVVNVEVVRWGAHLRSDARVIGYLPEHSVLITMPENGEVSSVISVDTECILRYLHRTSVAAFRSSVTAVATRPYPHLHLRYPAQIDRVTVRRAERVRSSIPARVRPAGDAPAGDAIPATLVDISTEGASIVAEQPLGSRGARLLLHFVLTFSGMTRDMEVGAVFRNEGRGPSTGARATAGGAGVEFVDLGQDEKIFLSGFVYEEMHRRRVGRP